MKTYSRLCQDISRTVTGAYSTSFSLAIKLLGNDYRPHIHNIYGLVRIADETVDTYRGTDSPQLLDDLENEIYNACKRGFSVNPVVQAFADTAREYGIDERLIAPFFASMRMDLAKRFHSQETLAEYIYGSAEVVGLMCLRVFCKGNENVYAELAPAAQRLGAAFQKVNFLRDMATDHQELQRSYFPGVTPESFDETAKQRITYDIREDFAAALPGIRKLPNSARSAVMTAYRYYAQLLRKIEALPASDLSERRVRVANTSKLAILLYTLATHKLQ